MQVVIVESPSKAKTINKYLGSDFEVLASYGHIRDLPSKDGSVNPDDDFAMIWETDAKARKQVTAIVDAVKRADRIVLATDPDREGEAISWHLMEVLRNKKVLKDKPVDRVAFNSITKSSVKEAMANPRQVDQDLVDAYLARRALDYLVGFTLSPVLWRKLPGARSAGRVQSVALQSHLRARDRRSSSSSAPKNTGPCRPQVATGSGGAFRCAPCAPRRQEARQVQPQHGGALGDQPPRRPWRPRRSLASRPVEAKPVHAQSVRPPFTTSTLQQEASRKLGFNGHPHHADRAASL